MRELLIFESIKQKIQNSNIQKLRNGAKNNQQEHAPPPTFPDLQNQSYLMKYSMILNDVNIKIARFYLTITTIPINFIYFKCRVRLLVKNN